MSGYNVKVNGKAYPVSGALFSVIAIVFVALFAAVVALVGFFAYSIYYTGDALFAHGWLTLIAYLVLFAEVTANGVKHSLFPVGWVKNIVSGAIVLACIVFTVVA